jgi:O-antigen/teichoic acid export membrane protein
MRHLSNFVRFLGERLRGIRTSDLGKRMVTGSAWALVSAVGTRAGNLIVGILLARILGKEAFGNLSIVQTTAGVFNIVAGFGLGATAARFVAEFKVDQPERAGRLLALGNALAWTCGGIASVALLLLTPRLASGFLGNADLGNALRLSAALVLIGALNGAQTGVLAGLEKFGSSTRASLWSLAVSLPLQVIGAWHWGVEGSLAGTVLGGVVNATLNHAALRQALRDTNLSQQFGSCLKEWRLVAGFSLPAMLSSMLVVPVNWICAGLLVRHWGGGAMASVSVANQWRAAVAFLPTLVAWVYFPIISSVPRDTRFRRISLTIFGANLAVGCGLCVLLITLSPLILNLYGERFRDGRLVFLLLTIVGVLEAGNEVLFRTLLALDRAWLRLVSNGLWGAIMLLFSNLLIPEHGEIGFAVSCLVAYGFHFIVQCLLFLWSLPTISSRKSRHNRETEARSAISLGR